MLAGLAFISILKTKKDFKLEEWCCWGKIAQQTCFKWHLQTWKFDFYWQLREKETNSFWIDWSLLLNFKLEFKDSLSDRLFMTILLIMENLTNLYINSILIHLSTSKLTLCLLESPPSVSCNLKIALVILRPFFPSSFALMPFQIAYPWFFSCFITRTKRIIIHRSQSFSWKSIHLLRS